MVLETAGGHDRNPNGILGLLCREHFPGLVEYAGVTSPAYTFDHYVVAPDAVSLSEVVTQVDYCMRNVEASVVGCVFISGGMK